MPAPDAAVLAALEDAQRFGFLGPGPVGEQVDHATAIASVLETEGVGPADFLDLGTGGGLPGLVLAARWSGHRATLLDGSARRTALLRRTIVGLGWQTRVAVAEGRAEALARNPELRSSFPLVVARSFAAPAVTAEVGSAFVQVGGVLVVSEPSGDPGARRWPAEALARLGLHPVELRHGIGARVAMLVRVDPVDERWPRGVGTPSKRPLW
jgi:16S rRNA (guanine527-N7)-methyltransferase